MKRAGALLFLCFILIMVLAGCSRNAANPLHEVQLKQMVNGAKSFAERISGSNGLYLYSPAGEHQYLIVNYSSALQGEEAEFLNSLQTEADGGKLTINLEVLGTQDHQDKRLKKMRIFELHPAEKVEVIQITRNGKAAAFDSVGG